MRGRKTHHLYVLGLAIVLVFTSLCLTSCGPSYPEIKLVNQSDPTIVNSIKGISLVGYSFGGLNIPPGGSQVFALSAGMPGGYQDINVNVVYGYGHVAWSVHNTFDFEDGSTTTISLYGSQGEGHPDYNNWRIE